MVALTPLAAADASALLGAIDAGREPTLGVALAAMQHELERCLLDQIVGLGRMSALERVARLLLGLQERLAVVGLADDRQFPLPLTQETLADVLGLSIVHVNRTLQQLRRSDVLETRNHAVVVRERDQLRMLALQYQPETPSH